VKGRYIAVAVGINDLRGGVWIPPMGVISRGVAEVVTVDLNFAKCFNNRRLLRKIKTGNGVESSRTCSKGFDCCCC
jgi:hypothetical protein